MAAKRSVSLYSYQEHFFLRKLDLEGCVREAAKTGARGIELIPEQNVPREYKNPSPAFVERWRGLLAKYDVEPACIDVFNDYQIYRNRNLTTREQVAIFESNIRFAAALGFPVVRGMIVTPLKIVEQLWPIAEHYGVKFGIELHAPFSLKSPYVLGMFEAMERTGTRSAGIIPDMGIFTKHAPKVQIDKLVRSGARQSIVDYIFECYEKKVPLMAVGAELQKRGASELESHALIGIYSVTYDDPQWLLDIIGKVIHIHGKCYEMDESCSETSIDYETVLPLIRDSGYDGFISTEYEGQRSFHDDATGGLEVDEIEQVRRHQEMMKRLLCE